MKKHQMVKRPDGLMHTLLRIPLGILIINLGACASIDQTKLLKGIPQLETKPLHSTSDSGDIQTTFFGVSTLLFKTESTTLLVDGFFSRPDVSLFKKITPDRNNIVRALNSANIDTCGNTEQHLANTDRRRLDAVVVVHSHYDHALDVADVADLTGAAVYGSESTANIVRHVKANESDTDCRDHHPLREPELLETGKPVTFTDMTLTAYAAKHVRTLVSPFLDGKIKKAFRTPARINKYREGEVYGLRLEAGGKVIVVHASARCPAEADHPGKADVVFLGIGGLGFKNQDYLKRYWDCMVEKTQASRVYAIHWDDFTQSMKTQGLPTSRFANIPRILGTFSELDGNKKRLRLPPAGVPFALTD